MSEKAVGVDATLLEACAGMKTIARRDSGEHCLQRLMLEEGVIATEDDLNDEELRGFDKSG